MKKIALILIVCVLLSLFGTSLVGAKTQNGLMWGAYDPNGPVSFEKLTGRQPDMVATFIPWGKGGEFPVWFVPTVRDTNKTLLIFWELVNFSEKPGNNRICDKNYSYDAILKGTWDQYLKGFAGEAARYNGPVIIVPFPEMNLNETNWSGTRNNNSAAKHIQAFRRLREAFRQAGAGNVRFGWDVNSRSIPNQTGNQIADYYPGDVDYVGVDGFDLWNQTFAEIFDRPLKELEQFNKPIMIFSWGCQEKPGKPAWIEDLGNVSRKHPLVVGWNLFNAKKERNWLVNSSPESLQTFQYITA